MNKKLWKNFSNKNIKNNFMSINDFRKTSSFTGQMYGKKVSIEIDHCDLDMNELMDAFKGIALGLGWAEEVWNDWVKETAYDIESAERIDEWNKEDSEWESENEVDEVEDQRASWDWNQLDTEWVASENDIEKMTSVISNPPEPNDELKKAADEYNDEVELGGSE